MDIISKEASLAGKRFIQDTASVRVAKQELEKKLTNYKLEKHKLSYLHALRQSVQSNYDEHYAKCKDPNCAQTKNLPVAFFVIDQEIEYIETTFKPKVETKDTFTPQEKTEIYSRINDIFEELEKLGLGQEILFNDLDELREHFDLGKKNWLKFLKGTLLTVALEKGIEKTIIDPIFGKLSEVIIDINKLPNIKH